MIKDISYSAYILPVRDGQVALLKYGENGYGPIGGRLDDGEDFLTALRRELTEELGESASALADSAVEIPVPYAFRHPTAERAQRRGALAEEHHFFIVHIPDDMELNFCENRPEEISVAWVAPDDLLNPKITPFDDVRDFYALHILPNLGCKFSMSLRPEYYEMVRSGEKDIELRLYDEKRRRMHNGDIILIYNAQIRKLMVGHPFSARNAITGTSILEKYTSNGLGTKFKTIIEKWARENNVHKLEAETFQKNMRSIGNLLKNGYEIVGVSHDVAFIDGEYYHQYNLEKILEK